MSDPMIHLSPAERLAAIVPPKPEALLGDILDHYECRDEFESLVEVRGEDDCWLWSGLLQEENGYGLFRIGYLVYKAHRIAEAVAKGVIPDHVEVHHRCDSPRCCNPRHLYRVRKAT